MRIGFLTLRMLLGYGVDLVIAQLARRLAAGGHSVVVFATEFDQTHAGTGFRLEKLEIPGGEFNRALPLYELNAGRALRGLRCRLADFDLLVPCTFPFYGVRSHFAGPVVHFDFGNVPTRGFTLRGRLNWLYLHLLEAYVHTLRADAVLTISQFLARRFLPEVRRRLEVLYLGGDHYWREMLARGESAQALREELRGRLGIGRGEVVLACCTRLHRRHAPYKNLPQLLEMFQRLRAHGQPVRLLLAGRGSPEDAAWLRGAGALVLANLPPQQMPAFYAAADFYASPSEWEGFNLPLVEAAWFGVPAVAYAVAAHPETGAPVLVASPHEFYQALSHLAGDAALRRRLGAAGRARAQRFTWDAAYRRFLRVLEGLAGR